MLEMIYKLGLLKGLLFWLNVKKPGKKNAKFFGVKSRIYWRDNGYDETTIREILLNNQYKLPTDKKLDPVNYIIDAGANIGISTIYFSEYYPDSKIYALEPEKENFDLLTKNTKEYENIISFNGALWSRECHLSLVDQGLGARGFCMKENATNEQDNTDSILALSVDSLMEKENIDVVDIVKIDIEGGEKQLFSENTEWIHKTKLIIIELHDRITPDCTKIFFNAIKKITYQMELKGENLFIFNLDLINTSDNSLNL